MKLNAKCFSAEEAIKRARQICKYEPEFHFNEENGMIQIWDYSEEQGQAFHREDYCKAGQINIDELFNLIDENHFYYTTDLYDARRYISKESTYTEYEKNDNYER